MINSKVFMNSTLLQIVRSIMFLFSFVLIIFVLLALVKESNNLVLYCTGIIWFPMSIVINFYLKSKIKSIQQNERH